MNIRMLLNEQSASLQSRYSKTSRLLDLAARRRARTPRTKRRFLPAVEPFLFQQSGRRRIGFSQVSLAAIAEALFIGLQLAQAAERGDSGHATCDATLEC